MVLFDDKVYIFYNTSPQTPTEFKLDKDELDELRNPLGKKQNTQLEPLGFELGARVFIVRKDCAFRQEVNAFD